MQKFSFLYLISIISCAQIQNFKKSYDSIINTKTTNFSKINLFFKNDNSDTIKLKYALKKSFDLQAPVIESYILNSLGVYYRDISNYEKAIAFHKKSLVLALKSKNTLLEVMNYNMLGVIYRRMDSIIPAINYHQRALNKVNSISKKNENLLRSQAVALNSIGNIYLALNQNELAKETFSKSLKIEKQLNNKLGIAINYQNIGNAFELEKKYDLALINYKKSLAQNKIINSKLGFMICENSIGSVLLKQNKPKEAFQHIFPIVTIAEKLQDDFYTCSLYINLGWAYLDLDNYKKAKIEINKGLKIALQKKYITSIIESYRLLSKVAEKQKKHAEANYFLKKYLANKDQISSEKNFKYLLAFITKYENERKQSIINLKNKEILINKLTIKSKEKQKWISIIGLLLMTTLGFIFYYRSRNRKKINEKLELLNTELEQANKIKMRFFGILNHDLRSPVANLIGFLHLQKNSPELLEDTTKKQMEDKIIIGAENLLSSMEDILLWSKGQMEHFTPVLKTIEAFKLFDDNKKVFSGYQKIIFQYENKEHLNFFTDEDYLKTIIRNLTNNAINAFSNTDNPTIIWKAYSIDSQKFLSISDNGFGAAQEQFKALYDDKEVVGIKSGLGLHLIRDLAKAINCDIKVKSSPNQGTTFTLSL